MDEYTEDYRNGFIDGVAGAIQAIFEECDEEMLAAVFQKLNIQKIDND